MIRIEKRLSRDEADAIRALVAACMVRRRAHYKLDAGSLEAIDQPYTHFLCEDGYACASLFDPSEMEATLITDDLAVEDALLAAVCAHAQTNGVGRVLVIQDRADEAMTERIREGGFEHAFTEVRMKLDETQFTAPPLGEVTLRLATDADRECIARLDLEAFDVALEADAVENVPADDVACTQMVSLGGETIGKLRVHAAQGTYGIYGFVMRPDVRGKGYGRAALGQVIAALLPQNPACIYLEVESENSPAAHLYASMGFVPMATFDYYARSL